VEAEVTGGVVLQQNSTGRGTANVVYDPNTRMLSWDISVRDLTSNVVQIHFHGPAERTEGGALQVSLLCDFELDVYSLATRFCYWLVSIYTDQPGVTVFNR